MLSPRAFSLSLIASHLLSSIWWRDESRAQAIVQAELASFRSELTWSEQFLRRSNSDKIFSHCLCRAFDPFGCLATLVS